MWPWLVRDRKYHRVSLLLPEVAGRHSFARDPREPS